MRRLRPSRLIAGLAVALLTLIAAACGENPFDLDELERRREQLAEARALWTSSGVDSYEFTVSVHCQCGPREMRVRVVDGAVVSRVWVSDGQPVPANELTGHDTVEELFAYIEYALDQRPAEIDAEYGARGVPASVFVDWLKNAIDEESGFGVDDFAVIPG